MKLTNLYGQSNLNKLSLIGFCKRPEEIGEEITFTGTGLDDCNIGGFYDQPQDATYKVAISDGTGPDKFDVSISYDGGTTYTTLQSGVTITSGAITIENDMFVIFSATSGHTVGDYWTCSCKATSTFNKASNFYCVDATKPSLKFRNVMTNESRANGLRGKSQTMTEGLNFSFPLSHPAIDVDLLTLWIYQALGKIEPYSSIYSITPTTNKRLPMFGLAYRGGKTITKAHYLGNVMENLTINIPASDGFVSASANMLGRGNGSTEANNGIQNPQMIVVSTVAENATSISIASEANLKVTGSTSTERLKNVHQIRMDVDDDGSYKEVLTFSDVASGGQTITIEAYSANTTTHNVIVVFNDDDTETTLSTEFALTPKNPEYPLHISAFKIGNQLIRCDAGGITLTIANTLEPRICSVSTGFPKYHYLTDQKITISFTRELTHWVYQTLTAYYGGKWQMPMYLALTGDGGTIGITFPLVDFLIPEVGDDGQLLTETINAEPVYQSGTDVVTITSTSSLSGIDGILTS